MDYELADRLAAIQGLSALCKLWSVRHPTGPYNRIGHDPSCKAVLRLLEGVAGTAALHGPGDLAADLDRQKSAADCNESPVGVNTR